MKASDGQSERGIWRQLAGDVESHQPQLWKWLGEEGKAAGVGRLQMPQRCPRGPETRVRQVRWGGISPERCNTNPHTVLENRTKTNTGQLCYGCLFSTHTSCFAWRSLNQPSPCPSLGFLGMLGACVTLLGCCCPLSRPRSFTVPLPRSPHRHRSSWGRALHGAPGGDLWGR